MIKTLTAFVSCCTLIYGQTENPAISCPTGGQIFALGISSTGKSDVINAHNNYRMQIALGNVTGQPKGTNLYKQIYDDQLGDEGRPVSLSCVMKHITPTDPRWSWVGQNLFIEWNSAPSTAQNWQRAVNSWFSENKNFIYPNKTMSGKTTGHYTQLIWATSQYVGCDFVYFNDTNQPAYPYAKLYTCNYGPGGNVAGAAPYSTTGNNCPSLC